MISTVKFSLSMLRLKNTAYAILLLCACGLFAQSGADTFSGEFRLLSSSRIGTDLYYFDGAEYVECRPLLNRMSASYEFDLESAVIRFFHKEEVVDENGDASERLKPVGEVEIPGDGRYFLVLRPQYENPDRPYEVDSYRVHAMPDILHGAESGVWSFVNLTEHLVIARLGEEAAPQRIPPQSVEGVRVRPDRQYALIQFAARIQGEAQLFYSTGWPVRGTSNYLVIFLPGSERRPISVIRFSGGS